MHQELGWSTLASRRAASEAMSVSLGMVPPTWLACFVQWRTHRYMRRGLPPLAAAKCPTSEQRWERKLLPTEEPKGGIPFQQASEQAKLLPLEHTCWPVSFDLSVYCLTAWLLAWCDQINFTPYHPFCICPFPCICAEYLPREVAFWLKVFLG